MEEVVESLKSYQVYGVKAHENWEVGEQHKRRYIIKTRSRRMGRKNSMI